MSDWFITDDDCLQCCRPNSTQNPTSFEFVQINEFPGHAEGGIPFWQVAHGTIYVHDDYSAEEIRNALAFYGYPENADVSGQILAEMFFEMEVQEYAESEHTCWNSAVERIAELTELALQQYMEPRFRSLTEQISSANERRSNTSASTQPTAPDLSL